jgi:hypothetical protein
MRRLNTTLDDIASAIVGIVVIGVVRIIPVAIVDTNATDEDVPAAMEATIEVASAAEVRAGKAVTLNGGIALNGVGRRTGETVAEVSAVEVSAADTSPGETAGTHSTGSAATATSAEAAAAMATTTTTAAATTCQRHVRRQHSD